MKFYVCATPYHLLVALCDIFNHNEKSYIYLSTHDKNVYNLFDKYSKNLNSLKCIEKVYLRKRGNIKERLFIENFVDKLEYRRIKDNIAKCHVIIFPWNPYSLFSPSEYIFKYAKSVTLIEEGANLYSMKKPSKKFLMIKKYLYKRNIEFYNDSKISDIMVQFPDLYPKHLSDKLSKLELDKMIDKIDKANKTKIVEIFTEGVDLSRFNEKSIIILTQPLSEDKFVSEYEKKKMYYDIIEEYKLNYRVIIKKHPREKTIYNYDLKNVFELEGSFPSEVFKLADIKFKKAIGICTSAVKFINAEESLNIDEDFLKTK
ncbi:MAG: polysialyltransferase family glycosyltransferase [Terrisporobacter othiniensis]|nr:polysialyltransferase family glycosyltransferase [Terrisporobacter othiniensis]MDU6996112.1 polysialyltransferase family glycosyltransferase [Terrisporobacter othiniensis]